jgi:hypothetical protein
MFGNLVITICLCFLFDLENRNIKSAYVFENIYFRNLILQAGFDFRPKLFKFFYLPDFFQIIAKIQNSFEEYKKSSKDVAWSKVRWYVLIFKQNS